MSYPPHFYASRVHAHYDELPELIRMQQDGELYQRAWNDHSKWAERLHELAEHNQELGEKVFNLREEADDFRVTIFNLQQDRDHYKRMVEMSG